MFDELKTFITVVEYKNFTKAAEVLHLSQPSVSAHIKNLENRFQTVLIHRSIKQKSIVISDSGYRLYQYAKDILLLTEQAQLDVPDNRTTVKGHLRLGASLTIGEYILPGFIADFSKKHPEVEVELYIDNTSMISQQVKELTLDVGLVEGAISSSYCTQEYILDDEMVLAMPYDPHFDPRNFDLEELKHKTWIVRERGSGTRDYTNLFLSSHEISPEHLMVIGSNYAILQAVIHGLGITITSHAVASQAALQKEISILPLDPAFHRHFSYILPKSITHNHVVECFIEELKNYIAHYHKKDVLK